MAIRNARDKSADEAARAARIATEKHGRQDVFTAHGNDFLRDQILDGPQADGPEGSALDAALDQEQGEDAGPDDADPSKELLKKGLDSLFGR